MTVDTPFGREFVERLNAVSDLGTTSSHKFDDFEQWFTERSGRTVEVTYVNGLKRQYGARLGAALLATPDVIVLLSTDSWEHTLTKGQPYSTRLEAMVRYVRSLHAVVACHGTAGQWRVESVVGPADSELRARLAAVFLSAKDHPVT